MKIQKKNFFFFFWRGGGGRVGWGIGGGVGGRGGCERRSKVFVKIQKKKKFEWGGGGSDHGFGWGRLGSKVWYVGDVGYGGCKQRTKSIDNCK